MTLDRSGDESYMIRCLRRVVTALLLVGFITTACTEETRERIEEALPSGGISLPSAQIPIPEPTGEPSTPGGEPTDVLSPTPTEEPTAEPTEEPTAEPPEQPTAEPTRSPAEEPGRLVLAIIAILDRILVDEPSGPDESPAPSEAAETSQELAPVPTDDPIEEPTPTEGSTEEPIEEPAFDEGAGEVAAPPSSVTDEDGGTSAWVWLVLFVAVLAAVAFLVFRRTDRRTGGP